jgi:hypothetical protein
MRAHVLAVLLVAACRFSSPMAGDTPGGDDAMVPVDAPPDISFDGPVECYGNGLGVNVCMTEPTMPLMIMGTPIDTDTSQLCRPANPTTLCVLGGTDVTIDMHVVVSGSRPLVIVATGNLLVKAAGNLDVASHHDHRGPGSDGTPCTTGVDPDPNDGGGGRGGSMTLAGGNGGTGLVGSPHNGAGGIAAAAMIPTTLRGGCPGSDGGGGGNRGVKGHGGGAVYLFASSSIQIDGTIDASGGGGGGADTGQDGGGGGGSGGVIAFDAHDLTFADGANIYANGGGGGEGSSAFLGGMDGKDPTSPTMAAAGGGDTAVSRAGTGGAGSVGTNAGVGGNSAGTDPNFPPSLDGGGGGGGGGGAIFVFCADRPENGHVSPPMQ